MIQSGSMISCERPERVAMRLQNSGNLIGRSGLTIDVDFQHAFARRPAFALPGFPRERPVHFADFLQLQHRRVPGEQVRRVGELVW